MTQTIDDERDLGFRLKVLRESARLSQAQLAARLSQAGLSNFYPQTILKLESGQRALKFLEARAYADVLGVSLDSLLGLEQRAEESEREFLTRRLEHYVSRSQRIEVQLEEARSAQAQATGQVEQLLYIQGEVDSHVRRTAAALQGGTEPGLAVVTQCDLPTIQIPWFGDDVEG